MSKKSNFKIFEILKDQSAALYTDDTVIITKGKVSNAIVIRMKKGLLHAQKYFKTWKETKITYL